MYGLKNKLYRARGKTDKEEKKNKYEVYKHKRMENKEKSINDEQKIVKRNNIYVFGVPK